MVYGSHLESELEIFYPSNINLLKMLWLIVTTVIRSHSKDSCDNLNMYAMNATICEDQFGGQK
jgi:hypothetical protein